MKYWNEIRTAYQVAKLGTVSAAASSLGVHRASVIRHIDKLEESFQQKLFIRHKQGYTPTETGKDLLRVAETADQEFEHLVGRSNFHTSKVSGELVVTSMDFLTPLLLPMFSQFQLQYPEITLRFENSARLYSLEYGETHVALRVGKKPSEPDYVVQPFMKFQVGLFASHSYSERFGLPRNVEEFKHHRFVNISRKESKTAFEAWLRKYVPPGNFVFHSSEPKTLHSAVMLGLGIGFLPLNVGSEHERAIEVLPRQENWDVDIWLVTHVDLHRTEKVQAFLKLLKQSI